MNKKMKLLGYYNYTVVLTYLGMISGFIGITHAFKGNIDQAVICLMISGVCDMFDGTIAATMDRSVQEKCFGIQIDSLSDLICFGVLPAIIVYSLNQSRISLYISALYVLCALIRLAYFNVEEQERQKETNEKREFYYGMPVTLSSLFLPLLYKLSGILSDKPGPVLMVTLLFMSGSFLSPCRIKKPKLSGTLRKERE